MAGKILFISILLAVVIIPGSCLVTSHDIDIEATCDDFSKTPDITGDSREVEIGDKIRIKLCSNATTGFEWSYETSGDDALKEEDYDFEEPESDVPGAAGAEVWTFEASSKGTTDILLEYSQPWEGGMKSEWTYRITVTVK